jgi:Fe-S cluster biogenesis protein NfuA
VTEISPLIISAGGATSVCSSTVPSVPVGVTVSLLGNCPTC